MVRVPTQIRPYVYVEQKTIDFYLLMKSDLVLSLHCIMIGHFATELL